MAENDNNKNSEFSSIASDEAITEIDFGSFLANKDDDSVLYEGFHEDIEKTEKSLEDELQSLYDDIMATGPATVVPKTIDEITAAPEEKKEASPLDELWMSPEEYIDIPDVGEDGSVKPDLSDESGKEKDDLFDLLESIKADTIAEPEYDKLIDDIESDKSISEEKVIIDDIDRISEDFIAERDKAKPVYESDSDEFQNELADLLGDTIPEKPEEKKEEKPIEKAVEKPAPKPVEKVPFVINIPDDDEVPGIRTETLIPQENRQKTIGVEPVEIEEDDGKISRKEKKAAKKEAKKYSGELKEDDKDSKSDIPRKLVLALSIIIIVVSCGVLVNTYLIEPYTFKKQQKEFSDSVSVDDMENADVVDDDGIYPPGMLKKYTKLYDINPDLRGWISIPALEIDLPIAQGTDNDYYLHRNIYKKRTNYGVPFFDYRIKNFKYLPKNLVIYGHNMHYDDLIFGMLENYREIKGFQKSPVIECNTIYGDFQWFVYAVFISNSKESHDNGYVFPYNFINISDTRFAEYITELDKRKFYTTGVELLPSDKILTLSTCCYDFDDARLVVVARLRRPGESLAVDTSKAVMNENVKYPQAWYNANKKQNPYSEDARWNPNSTV